VLSRPPIADEAYSRSINGVVERIYKDGVIVAERHRYDNKLTMSVLGRLDARIDRAEERGDPHLRLVGRWDEYLDALAEGRRDDGLAMLAAPEVEAAAKLGTSADDSKLRQLHAEEKVQAAPAEEDCHDIWDDEDVWWTNYPPPPGFDGEEYGQWDDEDYKRRLSPAEQAVIDAQLAAEEAADRAHADAQRDAFFGFTPAPAPAIPPAT
jgi:hypothetical protein